MQQESQEVISNYESECLQLTSTESRRVHTSTLQICITSTLADILSCKSLLMQKAVMKKIRAHTLSKTQVFRYMYSYSNTSLLCFQSPLHGGGEVTFTSYLNSCSPYLKQSKVYYNNCTLIIFLFHFRFVY